MHVDQRNIHNETVSFHNYWFRALLCILTKNFMVMSQLTFKSYTLLQNKTLRIINLSFYVRHSHIRGTDLGFWDEDSELKYFSYA